MLPWVGCEASGVLVLCNGDLGDTGGTSRAVLGMLRGCMSQGLGTQWVLT